MTGLPIACFILMLVASARASALMRFDPNTPVTLCSQSLKTSSPAGNLAPAVSSNAPRTAGALSDHRFHGETNDA